MRGRRWFILRFEVLQTDKQHEEDAGKDQEHARVLTAALLIWIRYLWQNCIPIVSWWSALLLMVTGDARANGNMYELRLPALRSSWALGRSRRDETDDSATAGGVPSILRA
jgi:hypothetical protein